MSRQQDLYLRSRSTGADPDDGAFEAGIPLAEARLIEADIARGYLTIPAAGIAAQPKEAQMAKKTQPGDRVTNLTETKDTIRNVVPRIVNLKNKRKEINEQIAAEREKVNALGIPKAALDFAIRMKELDPEVRASFDEGVAIARDAIALPMSRSLFDMLDERTGPVEATAANEDASADAAA